MPVVKINAISVEPERADELIARFAARAGQVDKQDGFEEFQLLKPTDDRGTFLVYTRWRDEESFQAWISSPAFMQGHAQPQGAGGPVATHSELWQFEMVQQTVGSTAAQG
jgi:heme oxygenase (mycobilin-producing)